MAVSWQREEATFQGILDGHGRHAWVQSVLSVANTCMAIFERRKDSRRTTVDLHRGIFEDDLIKETVPRSGA